MTIFPFGLVAPEAGKRARPVTLHTLDAAGMRCLHFQGALPRVPVPGGANAPPEVLTQAVAQETGMATWLLRVSSRDSVQLELVEPLAGHVEAPWSWWPASPRTSVTAPWQRPGWYASISSEVDACLDALGSERTTTLPIQRRATSVTALLEFPTTKGPVWLKAVAPGFAREGAVVAYLARLLPGRVPECLANRDGWWLAAEFPPDVQDAEGDCLETLACLQRRCAEDPAGLASLDLPRRPITALVPELAAAPADGLPGRVLLPQLERAAAELAALGLPETLVHGDVSPNNAHPVHDGWFLYDWTDACLSHPFIDLASPLAYEADQRVARARAERYFDAWDFPPGCRDRTYLLAQTVGAAHQAVTYHCLATRVDAESGDVAGGRQMKRFRKYWRRRAASLLTELT